MSTDPYAAPSADLGANDAIIPTSIWTAKGRLGILSYFAQSLLTALVLIIIAVAIMFVIGIVFGGGDIETMMTSGAEGPAGIAMAVTLIPLYLAMLWTGICFIIKRLHDRNHTGWWSLIFLIPLINLLLFLYIALFRGNKHSNRFGAPRPTKGWEKVVGVIGLILMVGSMIATVAMFGAAMFGMGGGGLDAMLQGG